MIFYDPIIQNLIHDSFCTLDILRLDLIDKEISGNKWFKLKRNLERAKSENFETIITFGGSFSNHIAATAAACKRYNLKCIGIIRGEQKEESNPTLNQAKKNGMLLHFVNREFYAHKNENSFKGYLENNFGKHYLIPEGGNNAEGILGSGEILKPDWHYDYIFCACGTGTTYAGLKAAKQNSQKIIGISVLKGENKLSAEIEKLLHSIFPEEKIKIDGNEILEKHFVEEDCIVNSYAFKGYAKLDSFLLAFKKEFESLYKIPLDHVYTTKLLFAVFDLIQKNKLKPKAKALVIHSGGLQGNRGFEERYHLIPNL